jgi:hypothetical protein
MGSEVSVSGAPTEHGQKMSSDRLKRWRYAPNQPCAREAVQVGGTHAPVVPEPEKIRYEVHKYIQSRAFKKDHSAGIHIIYKKPLSWSRRAIFSSSRSRGSRSRLKLQK